LAVRTSPHAFPTLGLPLALAPLASPSVTGVAAAVAKAGQRANVTYDDIGQYRPKANDLPDPA